MKSPVTRNICFCFLSFLYSVKLSSQLWDILSKLDPQKVDFTRMGNPFQFHLSGLIPCWYMLFPDEMFVLAEQLSSQLCPSFTFGKGNSWVINTFYGPVELGRVFSPCVLQDFFPPFVYSLERFPPSVLCFNAWLRLCTLGDVVIFGRALSGLPLKMDQLCNLEGNDLQPKYCSLSHYWSNNDIFKSQITDGKEKIYFFFSQNQQEKSEKKGELDTCFRF